MLLFVVLFLAPIFWVQIALQRGWLEDTPRTTHHGVRMQPPVSIVQLGPVLELSTLTADSLQANWWLVYIMSEHCPDQCADRFALMQSVKGELTGTERRSELGLLVVDPHGAGGSILNDRISAPHAAWTWLAVSANATNHALAEWVESTVRATETDMMYVMNPQGSLMMQYSTEVGEAGMVADLERLLR
ncbi:MAG: SCO family protein [Natronospirillum sp.]|uniref:SCO family protein n=1 Tax=Natronospirillum sp. TaxID=2812955 RepID=UPI0026014C59|nr:SCO family protein [Natronospirillum sp.]MCH8552783.1 SCO family protein [Natronospirillum sp.]